MRIDDALKIFQRQGPYTSRYTSVFWVILDGVSYYKETCHENKKVNVQTSLLNYFIRYIEEEPLPSTSASLSTFAGSFAPTDPSFTELPTFATEVSVARYDPDDLIQLSDTEQSSERASSHSSSSHHNYPHPIKVISIN
jgi:hypothetical protein